MAQQGRKETLVWPQHNPVLTYSALAAGLLCTLFFAWERVAFSFTPLQNFYIGDYIRSGIGAGFNHRGEYRLLYLQGTKVKPRLLYPTDWEAGETTLPNGHVAPVQLTELPRAQGYGWWEKGRPQKQQDANLYRWFQVIVFDGRTIPGVFRTSMIEGAGCLAMFLCFAVPADRKRMREAKYGRLLRGPRLLTPKQFVQETKSAGVGFQTADLKQPLRIHAQNEPQHIMLMGDTGTGKTQLLYQILLEIERRGDSAIVLDPVGEFVQRFYSEKRGDYILNPLDERCPYWSPAQEIETVAEADSIAASLYPPVPEGQGNKFFQQTPAAIFAHLLTKGPSPQQLAEWMSNEPVLQTKLDGTELAFYINRKAGPQAVGVLSSLALVAKCFRLLPEKTDGRRVWNARSWSKKREGWVFITTGRPSEREAMRPLHSLWLDTLILRLMEAPKPEQKRVWFVMDELASLQRLPQLQTALTENRKSNNPIVFGFQGKTQLQALYGKVAETMLQQPATKVFLRTFEPDAAEWISNSIGKVEIERLKETKFHGSRHGQNFSMDRQIEPLVMASEVSSMTDRYAYMVYSGVVVPFHFGYLTLPPRAPLLVKRDLKEGKLSFDPDTLKPIEPEAEGEEKPVASKEPQRAAEATQAVPPKTEDPKTPVPPKVEAVSAAPSAMPQVNRTAKKKDHSQEFSLFDSQTQEPAQSAGTAMSVEIQQPGGASEPEEHAIETAEHQTRVPSSDPAASFTEDDEDEGQEEEERRYLTGQLMAADPDTPLDGPDFY